MGWGNKRLACYDFFLSVIETRNVIVFFVNFFFLYTECNIRWLILALYIFLDNIWISWLLLWYSFAFEFSKFKFFIGASNISRQLNEKISRYKTENQQKLVFFFRKNNFHSFFVTNICSFDFFSKSEFYLNFSWFPSVFLLFRLLYPRPLSFFVLIKQWESKSNWLAFVLCVYCNRQNICKMPCLTMVLACWMHHIGVARCCWCVDVDQQKKKQWFIKSDYLIALVSWVQCVNQLFASVHRYPNDCILQGRGYVCTILQFAYCFFFSQCIAIYCVG